SAAPIVLAALADVAAKTLNALAGFLQHVDRGGIRNAEERAHGKGRTVHTGDVLLLEHGQHHVLIGGELGTLARGLADQPLAGWIHVEGPLRLRTLQALGFVEHGDHEVAPLSELLIVARYELLWAIDGLDGGPLCDRGWIGCRLRLQLAHGFDEGLGARTVA